MSFFPADDHEPADETSLEDDLERAYQLALEAVAAADGAVPPVDALPDSAPAESSAEPNSRDDRRGDANNDSAALYSEQPRVTPRQIIEAALFVGGGPLTARKLCSLLRGDFEPAFIEGVVDDLNQQYAAQNRPYEIRLGEGGYQLLLRPEFAPLAHRVYGLGPKEVKLSQDALELLALVAYRQPISEAEIEELGKEKPGSTLRQLLRRELIALERGDKGRKDVTYRTTPRFLQLFGLSDLDELPQADELSFK
jgi:segregation and condensation protein B